MGMGEVNIKLNAADRRFLLAGNMQVIAVELELGQLAFKFSGIHAQVEQGGDKHVAGDAAEEVEIEGFHEERISAAGRKSRY